MTEIPKRLEFGNPDHIKLAAQGYALGEAIEKNLKADLISAYEPCEECDGTGEINSFECGNCGRNGDSEKEVIYPGWLVRENKWDEDLIGRCRGCFALLENNS
jgi:hypothetical protein